MINSVAKRRRLLPRGPDIVALLVGLFLLWRLFGEPLLHRVDAPLAPVAPALRVPSISGNALDLRAEKGRTVIVDFFATWCEPCRQTLPLIEAFAAQHPDVRVLLIDVGEPKAQVRTFALQHHLVDVGLDPHAVLADHWEVKGFPTIEGIDGAGRLRDSWFGYNPALPQLLSQAVKDYALDRRDAKNAATAKRDS